MPFRPPLHLSELRAIQDRNPGNEDVLALLWEIKRLQSLVIRLNQVLPEMHRPTGVLGPAFDALAEQVPKEPCVTEISMRAIEVAAALARQAKQ
ncbi:hypothetical protein C0J09_11310 [Bordetella avium]|uniref:hypothetical protein n=1 Tax=Bordetella avium TaxID=521 RepID=UPI000FD79FA5|nr:hypothetical protein [Bordetella avium]AZY49660.1 hypothetical protein C0J09_11310 [Bordetella avium]